MLVSTKIISPGNDKPRGLQPTKILQPTTTCIPQTKEDKINELNNFIRAVKKSNMLKPTKSIGLNDNTQQVSIVKEKSIRFTSAYLQKNIPNYNNMYYIEMEKILSSITLNTSSVVDMFNVFNSLGEGVQGKVNIISSRLCQNVSIKYFDDLKNKLYDRFAGPLIGLLNILQNNDTTKSIFEEFNTECSLYLNNLEDEYNKFKQLTEESFRDLSRLYFYKDFFIFLVKELINRDICDMNYISTSAIGSRMVSITNSVTIIDQLKQQAQIKDEVFKTEMEIIQDYLFILCPSFHILLSQNEKEFAKQFKEFLRQH